jgi:UDP-N-acetylglucosamine 1-carboxyvinyltransferase
MSNSYLLINQSNPLSGKVSVSGAKNAVLTIIASLILTDGISILENVPHSSDVLQMIELLLDLGAKVTFDEKVNRLTVDTKLIDRYTVKPEIMNKMRASILVMGPLLARFQRATVALPGGCLIGARPINFHLKGFEKLGISFEEQSEYLAAKQEINEYKTEKRIVFEYPSVGATENILMFAAGTPGLRLTIVNAALEPEVLDLVDALRKMGAHIECGPGMIITIEGKKNLSPISHSIIPDRLEAGSLLLAAAITKGSITITNGCTNHLDAFIEKLKEMGHHIEQKNGIIFKASTHPQAVSVKTNPYPGFPTDLQAQTMANLCIANGTCTVEETVFENRLMHVQELQKMGAQISITGQKATIRGVETLYGTEVIASDIRASCALAISGLVAEGQTKIIGTHHWKRGYDKLEKKLQLLGADIQLIEE